jgi:hypothetical protein
MCAVQWHPEAEEELMQLPRDEQLALDHAVGKLAAIGPALPYPHQSAVKAGQGLRELRPRGGRSRWRALYDRAATRSWLLLSRPKRRSTGEGSTGRSA